MHFMWMFAVGLCYNSYSYYLMKNKQERYNRDLEIGSRRTHCSWWQINTTSNAFIIFNNKNWTNDTPRRLSLISKGSNLAQLVTLSIQPSPSLNRHVDTVCKRSVNNTFVYPVIFFSGNNEANDEKDNNNREKYKMK